MKLYENRELFEQLILATGEWKQIHPALVEKDYYVTNILRYLSKAVPDMIFKGGTSLSKCYKLIERFSEDIDITLSSKPTNSVKQNFKKTIEKMSVDLGLPIVNGEKIQSRNQFNRYEIDYAPVFAMSGLKEYIYIETVMMVKAFPCVKLKAASLIYDFLKSVGREDIIVDYGLEPFEFNVQSLERTFIDKVFAICDYYIDGRIFEHSRHIYDLYKILPHIRLNDELKSLVAEVREARKGKAFCYSAADGVDINEMLSKIIAEGTYKSDYEDNTVKLIYDAVTYDAAIAAVAKIAAAKLF